MSTNKDERNYVLKAGTGKAALGRLDMAVSTDKMKAKATILLKTRQRVFRGSSEQWLTYTRGAQRWLAQGRLAMTRHGRVNGRKWR